MYVRGTKRSLYKPDQNKCRARNVHEGTEQRRKAKQHKHTLKRMKRSQTKQRKIWKPNQILRGKIPITVCHTLPPQGTSFSPWVWPLGQPHIPIWNAWLSGVMNTPFLRTWEANVLNTHTHFCLHVFGFIFTSLLLDKIPLQDNVFLVDVGLNIISAGWKETKNNFVPGPQTIRKVTWQFWQAQSSLWSGCRGEHVLQSHLQRIENPFAKHDTFSRGFFFLRLKINLHQGSKC